MGPAVGVERTVIEGFVYDEEADVVGGAIGAA
jgi:hypothetical protein